MQTLVALKPIVLGSDIAGEPHKPKIKRKYLHGTVRSDTFG
jgi:hypothetical protein